MKLLLTTVALLAFTVSAFAEDTKLTVGQFTFALATPWKQAENTGMMTKAVLSYAVEGGSTLEAKFYDFGGPSGGVEANVKRWLGQFEGTPEVKKEEIVKDGTKVVLITATGTYLDGPAMSSVKTPRPDYTLLGAILEGASSSCFIKLTGPKADAAKAAESFKALATSPFPTK